MLDIEQLNDDEVAILTYAVERFHDSTKSDVYFRKTHHIAGQLRRKLHKEYQRRKLHWSDYEHE